MGSIIEFPTFYEHMSGRDNLRLHCEYMGYGTLDAAPGMDIISAPVELFTGMAYLIFTSVMLASFIVSAYKNKTMNLMFTYPVKRRNILASQMAFVIVTMSFIALSVGMAMKSSKAAIVTSFFLIFSHRPMWGILQWRVTRYFPWY